MQRHSVIRVLGPIDVLTSEGARSVGGGNPQRLLGALVVGAGRSVSTDRLVWSVWGDAPPPSAVASAQTYITRLRHLLGDDTIERSGHSYRLVVARDQIDAVRFEDLLVQANELRDDPERCRDVCLDALGLWRGEPFGDFADDEPFRLESIRLAELRLNAMELELECELDSGRREIVIAELDSVVEEYPCREHLWYLLVEALLQDDRRIEAMQRCQQLRDVLATMGLQPGKHLTELEQRVLAGTE